MALVSSTWHRMWLDVMFDVSACFAFDTGFSQGGDTSRQEHLQSVTYRLSTTEQVTCSTSEGFANQPETSEGGCMWWTSWRENALPHRHMWLGDGREFIPFYCTSCSKGFEGHVPVDDDDRTRLGTIWRGGLEFWENRAPPRHCDCGGWLQLGKSNMQEIVKQNLQSMLQTVQGQTCQRAVVEPGHCLLRICTSLYDTQGVQQLFQFAELFRGMNAILPTVPYDAWAKRHHCDLISASDAIASVCTLFTAIADFLFRDMLASEPIVIPDRLAAFQESACIAQGGPKHRECLFGKLITAANLPIATGYYYGRPVSMDPALKVFKILGHSAYRWR